MLGARISMKGRRDALESEKAKLAGEQIAAAPTPVTVHPIRAMISGIKVTPRTMGSGVELELSGDLAKVLSIVARAAKSKTPSPRWLGVLLYRMRVGFGCGRTQLPLPN
jgi:hypothetical protein